jgi:predicted dehydrogenase
VKRLLLVGLGRFGRQHLRVLSELEVPLGLVDTDARALAEARETVPSARCSPDLAALLPEAFAADVVVPSFAHRPVVEACLEAGLAVFCEKPLAATTEDAVALARLAEARKAVLQTGFVFRHHPATVVLMDLLGSGAIGAPLLVRARFTGFKRPRTDGGCATNDAVHFADLASLVFGGPALRARGVARDLLGAGTESEAFLALEFGPRQLCHIEASYHVPGREREVLVVGERGAVAIDFDAAEPVTLHRQSHEKGASGIVAREAEPERPPVSRGEPLRAELEDFLANARRGARPRADGWAGARATAAIEAALLSAREGRAVSVPQVGP